MSMLMDMTLQDFNRILASEEPAPGGGSTAALSGVLAAALTMMVVNLSVGKKSFEMLDDSIKTKIRADFEAVQQLNHDLADLVDEDTKAFKLVMEVIKLPQDSDQDRAKRSESMERANLYALETPLKTARKCLELLQHQINIARYGNKNAVSDIGVGAALAWAGLQGAALNVRINLSGIKNQSARTDASAEIEKCLESGMRLNNQITEIVNQRI
ncbi:MAG TPA: cyclodeaminase/cyclohydrolase family protein [Syntrophomonadaceae bacterium]|nr:cyclodeaminase/cyclohydrolase family protein [Syntrophomonadaceae bacterium]